MTQFNPEMENNWHFALANQQYGPVTYQDLRQRIAVGQLALSDLVWHPTLPNWVAAGGLLQFSDISQPLQYQSAYDNVVYAGFWFRFAACIIDYIVLYIANLLIQLPLTIFMRMGSGGGGPGMFPALYGFASLSFVLSICTRWLYYAWMESSSNQGSLGKMACGIKVTDMNGERISFAHATGRYFASILSTLALCVGYIIAGFTDKKQALHDMIAKTLVVRK